MADVPSLSRRKALAAVGAGAVGVSGFVAGVRSDDSVPNWLAGRSCDPSSLATSPMDWPFPRHDRANTGHAPARAGPDWPLEQTWETEWPVSELRELRTFVVANGVVVALLQAEPQNLLLGFSLEDGHVRWRRLLKEAVYGGGGFAASGMAFVEGEFADSPAQFVACSLGDGTTLWTSTSATHAPQTLAGGRILTIERSPNRGRDDDHFAVTARDARTGIKCWRVVHEGFPRDIAVADDRVIIPTHDRGLLALDPTSGDQQWRSNTNGRTAAIVDNRVISYQFRGALSASSLADGSVEWQVTNERLLESAANDDRPQDTRISLTVGAVTTEAVVYRMSVSNEYPDRLQARDFETGELLWDVGPEPTPGESGSYSRPVMVGENVLVSRHTDRGEDKEPIVLLRLDVADGTELDRMPLSRPITGPYTPIAADNTLLVPMEERLVAYR